MTHQEMQTFVDNCYSELEKKQDSLQTEFGLGLGKFQEYWWNQEEGVLQFKNNGSVELQFDVVFIGTWAKHKNNWLWAWANTSMIESVKKESLKIQELSTITGYAIFRSGDIECDERQAWELAAMSVHVLNGIGMYRSPGDNSDLFLAIMKRHK